LQPIDANENDRVPGRKWNNGFFFDRIKVRGNNRTVGSGPQNPVVVAPHAALPVVARRDHAAVRAQRALYGSMVYLLIQQGFFHTVFPHLFPTHHQQMPRDMLKPIGNNKQPDKDQNESGSKLNNMIDTFNAVE
jgi:hypothetical protein